MPKISKKGSEMPESPIRKVPFSENAKNSEKSISFKHTAWYF